jgi:hypothetical protein
MDRCVYQPFVVSAVGSEMGTAQRFPNKYFIRRRILQPERRTGVGADYNFGSIIPQAGIAARTQHHGERTRFSRRLGSLKTLKIDSLSDNY